MADQLETRMFIGHCVGKSGGLGTNALGAVKETMSKDDVTGHYTITLQCVSDVKHGGKRR